MQNVADELHISLYPMDIVWENPDKNRALVEDYFISHKGVDMMIVPETFTTGFGNRMAEMAEPTNGPTFNWAKRLVEKMQAAFIGTWVVEENGYYYNRLHYMLPDGSDGYYDKAHLFRVGSEVAQLERGTEKTTFCYKGWRIRPAVCYDVRFPKWLRNEQLDYDLMVICANWPASRSYAWRTLCAARAIENQCYVAACNRTGTDNMALPYADDSAVYDYLGMPIEGRSATISYEKLLKFRKKWPFYLDADE